MDMSHLQMPKHMSVPPQEEPSDLEELEQFAKAFKQRRIKLGFTQVMRRRNLTWSLKTKKQNQLFGESVLHCFVLSLLLFQIGWRLGRAQWENDDVYPFTP